MTSTKKSITYKNLSDLSYNNLKDISRNIMANNPGYKIPLNSTKEDFKKFILNLSNLSYNNLKDISRNIMANNPGYKIPLNSTKEDFKKFVLKYGTIDDVDILYETGNTQHDILYKKDKYGSYQFNLDIEPDNNYVLNAYIKSVIKTFLKDMKLDSNKYKYQVDVYSRRIVVYGDMVNDYNDLHVKVEADSDGNKIEGGIAEIVLRYIPNGNGTPMFSDVKTMAQLHQKRSIRVIDSQNMCAVVASLLGYRFIYDQNSYKKVIKTRSVDRALKEEALAICQKLNHNPETTWQFPDLNLLANFYTEIAKEPVRLVVIDGCGSLLYDTAGLYNPGTPDETRIYLLYFEEHFHLCTNPQAIKNNRFFCKQCNLYSDTKSRHKCFSNKCTNCSQEIHNRMEKCPKCKRPMCNTCDHKCSETIRTYINKYYCLVCQKNVLNSNICKACNQPMCNVCTHNCKDISTNCSTCKRLITSSDHDCKKSPCPCCKKEVNINTHQCFVQKTKIKKYVDNVLYYDIESEQSIKYEHLPVLIMSHFKGEDKTFYSINNFCNYVFSIKEKLTIMAHNQRGYDGYFILHWMLQKGITPQVCMQGSKIMSMKYKNLRFIDSLSHLPATKLESIPKIFGFSKEVKKGNFPYKLIKKDYNPNDHEWIQNMPHIKYYQCYNADHIQEYIDWITTGKVSTIIYAADIIEGDRNVYDHEGCIIDDYYHSSDIEFIKWYHSQLGKPTWNYQEELEMYCRQDVNILVKGMERYRELTKSLLQSDPISYVTLASHCLNIYTSKFMPECGIPINEDDFSKRYKNSYKANQWLSNQEALNNTALQREYRIGTYSVDGFDPKTKTIYEFHGCFWHGCQRCYPKGVNHVNHKSFVKLYNDTIKRIDFFKQNGYNVEEIWEHDFDILDKMKLPSVPKEKLPINIKDAMFGGRTETFQAWTKTGEKLKYCDVTSLYPYVQSTKPYPSGRRIKFINATCWDKNWFGWAKVHIIPPTNLMLPVLPHKDKKLTFSLNPMTGTWTTEEINFALDRGYKIDKIFDVIHHSQKRDDLFEPYVKFWMKIKDEASGWPSWCKTENDKESYIEIKHNEHVMIDANAIEFNPGLRSVAKLFLNSLWGKFGQNLDQCETKYATNMEEYIKLISDIKTKRADNLSNDIVIIKMKSEEKPNYKTSYCISTYTTSHARIHLYKCMEHVIKNNGYIVYCDTDSMFYGGDAEYPTDDLVGGMKNELSPYGEDAYIEKFVSNGAKSYAYIVSYTKDGAKHRKLHMKVKGITNPIIDIQRFEEVAKGLRAITDIPYMTFKKHVKAEESLMIMQTVNGTKTLSNTLDKRDFDYNTGKSVPFGYVS